MAIGVSFRVAPGVRLRASTRGVRASVGPRVARVHVGTGPTRVSSGIGPVTVSSRVGGSPRRQSRSASRPTASSAAAQANRQERLQEIQQVADDETRLTSLHLATFPSAERSVAAAPPPPPADYLARTRRALQKAAVRGIPIHHFAERTAARRRAAGEADDLVRRQGLAGVIVTQLEQVRLDAEWAALTDHVPAAVIAAVDAAFADNASRSTCVDAGDGPEQGQHYLSAVVLLDGPDMIPERKPALTPGGKPTLKKRTKTERNAVYLQALASTVVATAAEAVAASPATDEVRVLVLRADGTPAGLTAIYRGRLSRAQVTSPVDDPVLLISTAHDAQLRLTGVTREVAVLTRDPEIDAVAAQFADLAPGAQTG